MPEFDPLDPSTWREARPKQRRQRSITPYPRTEAAVKRLGNAWTDSTGVLKMLVALDSIRHTRSTGEYRKAVALAYEWLSSATRNAALAIAELERARAELENVEEGG